MPSTSSSLPYYLSIECARCSTLEIPTCSVRRGIVLIVASRVSGRQQGRAGSIGLRRDEGRNLRQRYLRMIEDRMTGDRILKSRFAVSKASAIAGAFRVRRG